jgi:hypothetical protein
MKKNKAICAALCFLFFPLSLSAQKNDSSGAVTHWSYSGGLEYNHFSPHPGGAVGIHLNYSPIENKLTVFSLRTTVSYDFTDSAGGDFAWRFAFPLLYRTKAQLYIAAEQGVSYIKAKNNEQWTTTTNGVLSVRIFLAEHFFIEPYGRAGFPVLFAGGVLAGMRYNYK